MQKYFLLTGSKNYFFLRDAFFLGVAALFFAGRPVLRAPFFAVFFADFLAGTFAPFFLASDKPIAIACFGSVTFRPERPEVNDPFLRLRIALATVLCAFFEYFAIAQIF
jgi:hypothetical protein